MDTRTAGRSLAALKELPPLTAATATMYGVGSLLLVAGVVAWQPGRNPRWVITSLAVLAVGFLCWILARGGRFTQREAVGMTAVQVGIVGALTWTTDLDLGAFANGTALPIVGVYAVWFLPQVSGRVVLYVGALWWVVAILHRSDAALTSFALSLVVQTVIATEVFARIKSRVELVARIDPLTGVYNLRGVMEFLEREMARAARRGEPLSVVSIDLDGLRAVNNTRGHGAGDDLLVGVARHWLKGVRRWDAVGRTGGDEFLLVLPSTPMTEARLIEQRLAATSDDSWSAGVAELKPEDTTASMLARADQRMYAEKAGHERS